MLSLELFPVGRKELLPEGPVCNHYFVPLGLLLFVVTSKSFLVRRFPDEIVAVVDDVPPFF